MVSSSRVQPLLFMMLLTGAVLRLVALDWGQGHPIHPDERHVISMVQGLSWDNLDPGNFAYGSAPLYLMRGASEVLAGVFGEQWRSYDHLFLVGRFIATLASLATIFLVFILGRELFDPETGLLAAGFLSLSVLDIQLAHFCTVESLLVLMVTLTFLSLLRVAKRGEFFDYALTGVLMGIAVATKFSALPLAGVLVAAHLFQLGRKKSLLHVSWLFLPLAFLLSFVSFYVCEPFAFSRFPFQFSDQLLKDFWEQFNMVRGISTPIYVAVYTHTEPYWYQARQLLLWGLGPPLGALCLAGFAYLTARFFWCLGDLAHLSRWRENVDRLLPVGLILSWLLPNAYIVGGFTVKFLRYLAPLLPFLALAGAHLALTLFRSRDGVVRRVTHFGVIVTLAYTAFYALAYANVFLQPHTHVQASRWFAEYASPQSTVLQEHWDEALPQRLPGMPAFSGKSFPSYEPDNRSKTKKVASLLADGDYFISSSDRIYGTILSVQDRWPDTSQMYKLLMSGELGYRLVAKFASPPRLFGIVFDDWDADESFLNYDHPTVLIFENQDRLSAESLQDRLTADHPELRSLTLEQTLRLLPEKSQVPASRSNLPTVLLWWICINFLAWLVFPLLYPLLRGMPDGGLGVSKTFGIWLVAYLSWLGATNGWIAFESNWLIAILIGVGLVSHRFFDRSREELLGFMREKNRLILLWEAVFFAVFATFLLIRAYNPEIYWGEKPMDFSFLNAHLRSSVLPVEEPWFSGSPLNYYYFGFVVYSIPGKLLGIAPGVLYNLIVATIPAQVFLLAASLALAVVRSRWIAILSGFAVAFAGNLSWPFFKFVENKTGFHLFWATSRIIPDSRFSAIEEYPAWTFLFADLHAHMMAMPLGLATLLFMTAYFFFSSTTRKRTGLALLAALGLGALFMSNTWDFITYGFVVGGLAVGAHLVQAIRNRRGGWAVELGAALSRGLLLSAAIGGTGLVLILPYLTAFDSGSTHYGFNRDGFVRLTDLLLLFGHFLWIHWSGLVLLHYPHRHDSSSNLARRLWIASVAWGALFALIVGTGLDSVPFVAIGMLLVLAVLTSVTAVAGETRPEFRPAWMLVSIGYFLIIGAECVTISDRMNTVFKFYNTIWYLLSIPVVPILYRSFQAINEAISFPKESRFGLQYLAGVTGWFGVTAVTGLVAISCFAVDVYGVLEVQRDARSDRPTLDGVAYGESKYGSDWRGIAWLAREAHGTPRILEAWGPSYQDFTRVSMHTGLPTLLGWEHHVKQRGASPESVRRRKDDIRTIYSSPDPIEISRLLQQYEVHYVFVGAMETKAYGSGIATRLETVPDLSRVFQADKTEIFQYKGRGTVAGGVPRVLTSGSRAASEHLWLPPASDSLRNIVAMAVASDGNLYTASHSTDSLSRTDLSGRTEELPQQGARRAGSDVRVGSIFASGRSSLLVSDPWHHRVVEISLGASSAKVHGSDLRFPRGAAIDDLDRIWIADTGNDRVLRLGEPALSLQDGPDGPLRSPLRVVPAGNGAVFVLCLGNAAVFQVDSSGEISKIFELPDPFVTDAGLLAGLAAGPEGSIAVSHPSAGKVFLFTQEIGLEEADIHLKSPTALAFDPNGVLLVADGAHGGIYRYSQTSRINVIRQGGRGDLLGQVSEPRGLDWDQDGNFWIADFGNHRIQKIRADGTPLRSFGSQGDGDTEFREPCDLVTLPDRRIAVADTWNHRIQILDENGRFVRSLRGGFFGPRGIDVAPNGNLYVSDTGNGRVKILTQSGRLIRTFGGPDSGAGQLANPFGIAIGDSQVYVADVNHRRLAIYDLEGNFLDEIEIPGWTEPNNQEAHVTVVSKGRVLVTVPASQEVLSVDVAAHSIESFSAGRSPTRFLQNPTGIDAFGSSVIVSSSGGHRIVKFHLDRD